MATVVPSPIGQEQLLRLPQVLSIVPVSRATWWKGIKEGRFPPGIKLAPKTTVWRKSAIDKLLASL